jgi:hypothetical protein
VSVFLVEVDCRINTSSIIAALQNKTPAIQTPTVPRLFHGDLATSTPFENVDLFGQCFTSASPRPPFAPGVINALCDLTILQNEVTKYNDDELHSDEDPDLSARIAIYNRVLMWRKSLPDHLLDEVNHTPGTSLLRVHYEEVAIFALRFLHRNEIVSDHISANELRVIHCQRIVETVERHFRSHLPGDYSAMFLNALYHACVTLIPSLDEPTSQEIFTRAAVGLRREPLDLPGLVIPIRGIEAVARGMKKRIPPVAMAAFHAVKVPADTGDVLIEYGFPLQLENIQKDGDKVSDHKVESMGRLSTLLHRWNALTL